MNKYPYFLFQVEPDAVVLKQIHLVPLGEDPTRKGITIVCMTDPYEADGKLEPLMRTLIRQLAAVEQRRSGLPVCAVYAENDCDYFGPNGEPFPSEYPPKLDEDLLENKPTISIEEHLERTAIISKVIKKLKAKPIDEPETVH